METASGLVVAGCLAERYRAEIQRQFPEIDFVLGPDELGRVIEGATLGDGAAGSLVSIDALYTSREVPTIPRLLATPPHLAYLKVAEGCDHTCAFCAIPSFRGKFRSRPIPILVDEARGLAEQGVRELVIVSQDTAAYGKDLGLADGLPLLLEALLEVDGIRWIRFLYCYPHTVTDRLIRLVAEKERLCSYFDIPFQHASRSVLRRMSRGGHREAYEALVRKIRRTLPGVGLRTSFIVGFPGETDADFAELETFIANVRFDSMGVFLYSDEEGTPAFELDHKVPRRVAVARRNRLMRDQKRISKTKLDARVGGKVTLLLEGVSEESGLLLEGRTETQAPEIDGRVLVNDVGNVRPESEKILSRGDHRQPGIRLDRAYPFRSVVRCSTCKKEVEYWTNPYRPFCSERCKLIDLGRWAAGGYRIPQSEPTSEEPDGQGEDEDEQ